MSDPFRQFFLDTVGRVITQPPSEESLLELLQIVSPNLTYDQLLSSRSEERKKIFKSLILRIHPDKHPKNASVTTLFQNVQSFYNDCSDIFHSSALTKLPSPQSGACRNAKRRRRQSKPTNHFPHEFSIYSKWSHLDIFHNVDDISTNSDDPTSDANENTNSEKSDNKKSYPYPYPPNKQISKNTLALFQAYKCIHARGALVHGKQITKYFPWEDIDEHAKAHNGISDVFNLYGGTKELKTVEEIKEELITNGPVVSASFHLTNAYLDQLQNEKKAFATEFLDRGKGGDGNGSSSNNNSVKHAVLIVGWKLTPFGEAWKVQYLFDRYGTSGTSTSTSESEVAVVHIGFGQFNIDNLCLVPKSNLENMPWQHGPYFDADFSDAPRWRDWKEMDLPSSESELVLLGKCFKNGLFSGEKIVIRDRKKVAHSASYFVKNVRWDDDAREWIITVFSAE
jgi:hypothetical protein